MKKKQKDIVKTIHSEMWGSEEYINKVIDSFMWEVVNEVSKGNSVTIRGFGTFEPKHRAPRTGRNPHTGEAVPIPATVVPFFTPSEQFKNKCK